MTEPEPEDEPEGDEPEIVVEPPQYFWTNDPDEQRRAFIIETMSDADIDGPVLVSNMEAVFQWLKNGTVSAPKAKK